MTDLVDLSAERRGTRTGCPAQVELALELPPGVSACALSIDDLSAVAAALDDGAAGAELPRTASPKRRAEYLAGRRAAALALGALGISGRVGRGDDGLPIWPDGSVGSISHGGGLACALCGSQARWRSIGVDVESTLQDREALELGPAIAHPDELFLLRQALPHARPGQRMALLFSAKESLFKCLYPLTRVFLEFHEARVVSVGMTSRERGFVTLRVRSLEASSLPSSTCRARFALSARRVESAVFLDKE